jgi:hypothetical protein
MSFGNTTISLYMEDISQPQHKQRCCSKLIESVDVATKVIGSR